MRRINKLFIMLFLILIILTIAIAYRTIRKPAEKRYFVYCTCGHANHEWRGRYHATRQDAERDMKEHNELDGHCATTEDLRTLDDKAWTEPWLK